MNNVVFKGEGGGGGRERGGGRGEGVSGGGGRREGVGGGDFSYRCGQKKVYLTKFVCTLSP